MRITAPATLAARQHLQALAADIETRPGLSRDARYDLRCQVMILAAELDAAEADATHAAGEQVLAMVREAARQAAPDLIDMFLARRRRPALAA